MDLFPPEMTWFGLVTAAVAALGVGLGAGSLYLTIRRDRQAGRVNLRLTPAVEGTNFVLRITNTERRPLSAERGGLALDKKARPLAPLDWDGINPRPGAGSVHRDPPLPRSLAPGEPAYPVRTPLYAVRGEFFPDVPKWAWVEDAYGKVYWQRLPASVQDAIRATKRQRPVDDDYGGYTMEEIDDDEPMWPDQQG
jgi:hypothetical protein